VLPRLGHASLHCWPALTILPEAQLPRPDHALVKIGRLSRTGNCSTKSTTLCDPHFRGHSLPAKSVDSSVFASLFNGSLVSTCECSSPLDLQTRQIVSAWFKAPNSIHLPPGGRRQRGTGSFARGLSVAGISSRYNFDTNKPKRESSNHHLHPTRLSLEPRQVEDRAAVQAPPCPDKASGKGRKQSRNALCILWWQTSDDQARDQNLVSSRVEDLLLSSEQQHHHHLFETPVFSRQRNRSAKNS
jgi:hypothetical protein